MKTVIIQPALFLRKLHHNKYFWRALLVSCSILAICGSYYGVQKCKATKQRHAIKALKDLRRQSQYPQLEVVQAEYDFDIHNYNWGKTSAGFGNCEKPSARFDCLFDEIKPFALGAVIAMEILDPKSFAQITDWYELACTNGIIDFPKSEVIVRTAGAEKISPENSKVIQVSFEFETTRPKGPPTPAGFILPKNNRISPIPLISKPVVGSIIFLEIFAPKFASQMIGYYELARQNGFLFVIPWKK